MAPFVYIFAATGIVTLLAQWNNIFPLNPFARILAFVPLALVVLITSQYHIERYYSAWAQNPEVKAIYAVEPTLLENAMNQRVSLRDSGNFLLVIDESEHDAIELLSNDIPGTKDGFGIVIITRQEFTKNTINDSTDIVYVDSRYRFQDTFDDVVSREITSPRESRPVPYIEYSFKDTEDINF